MIISSISDKFILDITNKDSMIYLLILALFTSWLSTYSLRHSITFFTMFRLFSFRKYVQLLSMHFYPKAKFLS